MQAFIEIKESSPVSPKAAEVIARLCSGCIVSRDGRKIGLSSAGKSYSAVVYNLSVAGAHWRRYRGAGV